MAAASHYTERLTRETEKEKPSPIVLIDLLIEDALARKASDIHLDPFATAVCVRLRIDGLVNDAYTLPRDCHLGLIARLKLLAGLRTDEHQKSHDGRFALESEAGHSVDVRLSIMPTHYGENAVLRLLARDTQAGTLSDLGLNAKYQREVETALSRAEGFVIVTGPTGSGKTTTLYAMLQRLTGTPRSIVTIEDPVEYVLPGITQISILPHTGLTLASALRAVLRQDPDVLLVGEIRDAETARLATNAALTGHLVLSTLHAASARAAVPRLIDMGVEPYLVSATVSLVISQRLVRTLCSDCVTMARSSAHDRSVWVRLFGDALPLPDTLPVAVGCATCSGSGYQGRIGIFEITRPHTLEKNQRETVVPMLCDGYEKLIAGRTTLEELARIRYE